MSVCPCSVPPASYPVVTEGTHFAHQSNSGAVSDPGTFSWRGAEADLRFPQGKQTLSCLLPMSSCGYDAEYFHNSLCFEGFFSGSYSLTNTISHQNVLSKGGHKSKGIKQWACKTNQTGEQETLVNNNNNSPLLVLPRARCCSKRDIYSNIEKLNSLLRLHPFFPWYFSENVQYLLGTYCV